MPDRQDGRRLLPRLTSWIFRHCEERSDAAIQSGVNRSGLLRSARNDGGRGGNGPDRKGYDSRPTRADRNRSEEHTSELQSLMRISYAVFCLKKKKKETTTKTNKE